ncbi:hypothetical protein TRIATDRAFT_255649 [Trichoderma atroviride IMI 206040]|uniref:Uncharacterized protein n=1 Tax=Hypocrea atroviridis (strain ATCC 20476 / IMI 206040) TaxID=452589 RepID=G9NMI7_HYPAI|nr:uncharacterized protein TRIATDRAFT_255649 [Trichoderma atroviride IMI 206040]EHK48118.1 hypothetical protein TRIATDRAFT_255649 [Trichoderma atroviride IMI 206040]
MALAQHNTPNTAGQVQPAHWLESTLQIEACLATVACSRSPDTAHMHGVQGI